MVRVVVLALLALTATARADDPVEIGAMIGPRIYSQHSTLGYIDDAPYHPMLQNAVELGARVQRRFLFPWFFPEFELAFAPTHTNTLGGASADVLWMEPRVQARIELLPQRRLIPFLIIGAGAPIAFSSARKTFNSGIVGDGYAGAGVRFDTGRNLMLRADVRIAMLPGVDPMTGDNRLAFEGDVSIGVELALGKRPPPTGGGGTSGGSESDRDNDGIPDAQDQCPDRPEDKDGFQDADGCPDIDNDGDHVLDVADKCPTEKETLNGYQDDDGCPDMVPQDIEAVKGTIEGLIYGEAESGVHDSAQASLAKIAKVMQAHPTLTIVLVGHTDNQEAKQLAPPAEKGAPPPDVAQIAIDLAKARAEAVRQMLVAAGVPVARINIDGVGSDEPVADNATAKGRLANRRVELKLFVAKP
jgi:outer membrane protein OmpA-like peptidoglycan-associated protein